MTDLLSHIELAKPSFLWLLTILVLLWIRFRRQPVFATIARSIILVLLVLALADPQSLTEQAAVAERVFAFDLSKSVPSSMRKWMDGMTQGGLAPRSGDRVFVFGANAQQVENWDEWLRAEVSSASIHPERTNLEKLFSAVLDLPTAPRTLVLFTDGWETEGNIERVLPAIRASGIKIFPVLPAERPKIANVAVKKLLAPTQGNSGEAVNLKVVVENQYDREIEGTLTLTRNGQPLKSEAVKLKPGSQIFSYLSPLPDSPLATFRTSFTPRRPDMDAYLPDNQALASVAVRTKAKVLLLNGRTGGGRYLEEIFKREGFEVTSRTADSPPPPNEYSVVIFNNVEREKFSAGYLASIEKHVAEGNGFVMLGGEASFGPGGYRRTPIETILPVEFREAKREEKNRAVVLVIDKSGSMRDDNRILYAQEAAKAVARQLRDQDLLGVVGFDISPFVVVPLSSVGTIRGSVDQQLDRLKPGGRTFLLPAIIEAKRQLERQNAGTKHVIILSDGETGGSGADYIDLVNVMRTESKITVSTIAVGNDVNIPLMSRIAQYGGGFYHHTYDPKTLPQLVLQQVQGKPRDEPAVERDLTPVQERGSELLAGFAVRSYPALRGYIETELKRGAHLDLYIPREERKAPLLASWRFGKGKTVAFTSDLEGRWTKSWIQWEGLQKFWDKILGWLIPPKELLPAHEVRVSLFNNDPLLELYIYEEQPAESQFRYSIDGKTPKDGGALNKLAPGYYQTKLPISSPGDYRIDLTEERAGRRRAFPPVGFSLPHSPTSEITHADFNRPLIERLAQVTGGEVNPNSLETIDKHEVKRTYSPLRQYLVVLAGLLFVLEVAVRRFLL